MIFKFFKKIASGYKNTVESSQGFVSKFIEKANSIQGSAASSIDAIKNEISKIRAKFSNLLESNYQLGLYHLERGNLTDAIFRFRFIKKFWPNHYESYYQLAYCLILNKKYQEAQSLLKELISKSPEHEAKAKELMAKAASNSAN